MIMDKKFPYIDVEEISNYFSTTFAKASAETIAWIGLVLILSSTIPTMLSIMSGLSDKMPPVDLILFIWAGLSMMFIRATIVKDMLHIVTIGAGFIIHASFLALILFK
jgi:hypothetical protein